ncbi:MAG TPA: exodeoxyribonuclease VII large subunit [Burkholderiaceae bacterium]|nr:exodeoxyribonuclease VII large subunit [Burkholderiaceae bacterium]
MNSVFPPISQLSGTDEPVLTVTQLNRRVGQLLQASFSRIWLKGEISNFTQAASGHWYFSIKDEHAAVRAVMFRGRAQTVGFVPKSGERCEFRVTVTLYEPRGDYQVQVEAMRRAGLGDLHEAFLRLKQKLEAEGLFAQERKRVLPRHPRRIGVITSLAAAALRDVLTALRRRAPHVPVIIYPAAVQGADAPAALVQALRTAGQRNEVDTLLLVRGGGSLEDLWSFNDEALARAIAESPVPVISGVGHETDFTIADFVADLRAPTPTAAAELCCQPRIECLAAVNAAMAALTLRQSRLIETASLRLDRARAGLVSPRQRLVQQAQRMEALQRRLGHAIARRLERHSNRLSMLSTRLDGRRPRLDERRRALFRLSQTLERSTGAELLRRRQRLAALVQTLEALGPRSVLERGFAIARDASGKIVKNGLDLKVGETLQIEFGRGSAQTRVLAAHGLL